MEKRTRGRPRTAAPDQKREAARERQQERRRRLAEEGGRSITLAVPGAILAALDAEAKKRGIPRSDVLLEAVRTQIQGSEPAAAVPVPQILGSETAAEPLQQVQPSQIHGSGTLPPRYRGRTLLLAAAVGAVLGNLLTLAFC